MKEQIAAGHQKEKQEPQPKDDVDLFVDNVHCWRGDNGALVIVCELANVGEQNLRLRKHIASCVVIEPEIPYLIA